MNLQDLKFVKQGRYQTVMPSWFTKVLSGLGEVGVVLTETSSNPEVKLIAGLATIFLGNLLNPAPTPVATSAGSAKAALYKK